MSFPNQKTVTLKMYLSLMINEIQGKNNVSDNLVLRDLTEYVGKVM
jgi:hypothetical protein